MIWMKHKKYTAEYVSAQLNDICNSMRRETRRMIYVASGAVALMVLMQATCFFELLNA